MSLILEALRKSEAERQIGRPPGLLTSSSVAPPERKRRLTVPLSIMAALLVAGGAWWLGVRSAAPPDGAGAPAVAESPPTAPPPTPASALTPASTAQPTGAAAPTRPAPPQPALPAESLPEPTRSPSTRVEAELPVVKPDAPAPPTGSDPVAAESPAERAPTATSIAYARIDQMPAAERSSLPELKITVHVFSEDPDRRFAILDGRRRADGDVIQDGLSVAAILPDGVLLKVGERTWMLPRP